MSSFGVLFNHEEHFYPSYKIFLKRLQGKPVNLYQVAGFFFLLRKYQKILGNTNLSPSPLRALLLTYLASGQTYLAGGPICVQGSKHQACSAWELHRISIYTHSLLAVLTLVLYYRNQPDLKQQNSVSVNTGVQLGPCAVGLSCCYKTT